MHRGWILLILLLCSCGAGAPTPTATPSPTPPRIESEEDAVLSALIRHNPIGYDLGSQIVIRSGTASIDDMIERALEEAHDLPAGLVDSYRSLNAASHTIDPNLDIEQHYTMMPEAEWDEVFGQSGSVWTRFEARYPQASGIIVFSRVGFDEEEDTALAFMYYRCGDLCGAGGLYVLVKTDGSWKVQDELMAVQS
jgi:hypothetical protein